MHIMQFIKSKAVVFSALFLCVFCVLFCCVPLQRILILIMNADLFMRVNNDLKLLVHNSKSYTKTEWDDIVLLVKLCIWIRLIVMCLVCVLKWVWYAVCRLVKETDFRVAFDKWINCVCSHNCFDSFAHLLWVICHFDNARNNHKWLEPINHFLWLPNRIVHQNQHQIVKQYPDKFKIMSKSEMLNNISAWCTKASRLQPFGAPVAIHH